jgi:hypothetical protein
MPLFLFFIIFLILTRQQWDTWELHWLIFDDAGGEGGVMKMKGSSLLMFVMWEVFIWEVKVISLLGLEPMPCISVALIAQYLKVHQRKLGTIIIQTVHILQHDSADTGSQPKS